MWNGLNRYRVFNKQTLFMYIKEVTSNTVMLTDAIVHLLRQLTTKGRQINPNDLDHLIASENSHLFVAMDDNGNLAGMITVGIYEAPTGRKGWIEDVVVDEAYRGRGIGKQLTLHAIDFAKQQFVNQLSLTSNPGRVAANKLYPQTGFSLKETNVYIMTFD